MMADHTTFDPLAWEALKNALNRRVLVGCVRLVPSKRNRVWFVETDVRPVVVKRFLSGRCGNEFEALLQARKAGLDVPYPLCKEGEYLVTEFVPGDVCDGLINHMFSSDAAEGIGAWLARYHRGYVEGASCRIMADAVLSNFILSEGRVFGVDLEDSCLGNPMDDLGQVAASILGNEPYFTPIKFDLCLRLIRSYERSAEVEVVERVRPYVSKHLRFNAKSRPLFRRTFFSAAKSLERGWPELA